MRRHQAIEQEVEEVVMESTAQYPADESSRAVLQRCARGPETAFWEIAPYRLLFISESTVAV